ncbi:hypothetical protein THAOC_36040 [Thalassiosira oceanica]|uniref:Uncharacterized protein n=1 Tax=Thalassiosira oceanica TaxID=159749 RepID=K0R011_THAOC|nr:hypothetical protein THAOC_36040 [Thalassiosira oceanica]|eukprot:EJK45348.1 hypothetical protein THAOC_36040 [Thalassiosira oceanica]
MEEFGGSGFAVNESLTGLSNLSLERRHLHLSNNRDGSSELLVDHKSKDAHHGGTAVVELNTALDVLGLLIKSVPAEVNGAVPEVTDELILARDILHDTELKKANEGNHLDESSGGDGVRSTDGGPAVGERVERVSGPVDASAEVDSGAGDDVSEEGKHRDTSVLELDESEAVESLLVGVVKEAERIVESKRLLDSELTLEGIELGGGLAGLGRGEGGGRADEGEGGNRLHGGLKQVVRICVWVEIQEFRAEDRIRPASNLPRSMRHTGPHSILKSHAETSRHVVSADLSDSSQTHRWG